MTLPAGRHADAIVIGAGLAGLQCARVLQAAGLDVVVLEKSRGVGGRCATRRWDGVRMDHGAQFFTTRDPEFAREVSRWLAADICHLWTRRLHRWRDGRLTSDDARPAFAHYACRSGMNALGKYLAGNLPLQLETTVTEIAWEDDRWKVTTAGKATDWASPRLICTAPIPQVQRWFAQESGEWKAGVDACMDRTEMRPCLALLLACPTASPEWHGIQIEDGIVSWIGHDSSKRPADSHGRFVVHASPEFSAERQDGDLAVAGQELLQRAATITDGLLATPVASMIHRWRYAKATRQLKEGAVSLPAPGPLVLAGDAFHNGRVSGAWLSGAAAARAILHGV